LAETSKIDKKEFLINIAIDLFAKKGFSVTTMRDIAKEAGVNLALIYYYFKDKEELLYYIVERSSRELVDTLREVQSSIADPFEGLKEMITRQVLFSNKSWKETKLITIEGDHLHDERKKDCENLQRQVYDIYKVQLQRMKEAGYLSDVNLTVVNFTIFGMINWFYRWYKEGQNLTEKDIAKEMIKILQFGILTK
jgi:TetR/AcrR family transcriptional regulator, cholesterol catabolism regulator